MLLYKILTLYLYLIHFFKLQTLVSLGCSCILSNSETSILAVKPYNHNIDMFHLQFTNTTLKPVHFITAPNPLVLITLFHVYISVLRFHCCLVYRHNRFSFLLAYQIEMIQNDKSFCINLIDLGTLQLLF